MGMISSELIKTIGIVSDTHIRDQASRLPSQLLSVFQDARVGLILHAGDICTLDVLENLQKIAPVCAVLGNRDFQLFGKLPLKRQIQIGQVKIGLAHGYISFWHYVLDKLHHFREGYQFERYANVLKAVFPQADVIVFGHTHIAELQHWQGKLYLNPGACSCRPGGAFYSFGILRVYGDGSVQAEILDL